MDAQLWSLKKLERMQVGFTFQTLYIPFTDFFFFLNNLPFVIYVY